MSNPTDTTDDHTFAPLTLPLIPLEDALVLPGMALSVDLASPEANAAIDEVGDDQALLRRSHREAGLAVLLAPDVPAVLLEMGFITNPTDEALLANPASRGRLVAAVASAIEAYFRNDVQVASR